MTNKHILYVDASNIIKRAESMPAHLEPFNPEDFIIHEVESINDFRVGTEYRTTPLEFLEEAPLVVSVAPAYAVNRFREYPTVAEQLDMLWHAMDSNAVLRSEPFYSTIRSIKERNPKEIVLQEGSIVL